MACVTTGCSVAWPVSLSGDRGVNSLSGSHTQPADSAYGSLTRKVAQATVIAAIKGATEVPEGSAALWGEGCPSLQPLSPLPLFFSPSHLPALDFRFVSSLASWVSNSSRLSSSSLPHVWQSSLLHPSRPSTGFQSQCPEPHRFPPLDGRGSQPSQCCNPSIQLLMLWFIPDHKIISLVLHDCNFANYDSKCKHLIYRISDKRFV